AVRPVALEPESLRVLRARQPAQWTPREIVPAGGEECEHDEGEITPPHEAVAAGTLELRVELRRRDHSTRIAIRQEVEDEQAAPVEGRHVGSDNRGLFGRAQATGVVPAPRRDQRIEVLLKR